MTVTRAELEAAIIAAPLEPGPRMVYGDWLQAQGDPRGEWAAMMAAIEAAPRNTRLRSAAVAYLDTHRTALLGEGATVMERAYFGWRGGFIDEIRLQPASGRTGAHAALLRHPTCRFVRHVALGAIANVEGVVVALAA